MDTKIAYRGEVLYETDLLWMSRFIQEALGQFTADMLGTVTRVAGLACTPSSPAALTVQVAPGRMYSLQQLSATVIGQLLGIGGLDADTAADHQVMKQGLLRDTTTLSGFPAPGTAGQSINYLIQATFTEADSTPTARQFYNTTDPTNPINNPVSDFRQDRVVLTVKAGTAATTGSQTTPAADAGAVPLYVVTVANGQTTITSGNIAIHGSAPFFLPYDPTLPTRTTALEAEQARLKARRRLLYKETI